MPKSKPISIVEPKKNICWASLRSIHATLAHPSSLSAANSPNALERDFSQGPTSSWRSTLWFLQGVYETLMISFLTILELPGNRCTREVVNLRLWRWAHRLLGHIDVHFTVHHEEPLVFEPGRRYVLMSNHRSYYDIPLIFAAIPGTIRMIAKRELFRVPLWGRAMLATEFVSMDRKDREKSMESLKLARQFMERGVILWLAPEGTRSRDGKLLPLRKGGFLLARQTDAILIPIGLRGTEKIMPPGGFRIYPKQQLSVHIGKPIDTAQLSRTERRELLPRVTQILRELTGETA